MNRDLTFLRESKLEVLKSPVLIGVVVFWAVVLLVVIYRSST